MKKFRDFEELRCFGEFRVLGELGVLEKVYKYLCSSFCYDPRERKVES